MKRAPLSVSIQPQMLGYGVILAAVCGLTYMNERSRDEEGIEAEVQARYRGNIKDIQVKNDQIAAKIRGQDTKLDGVMNKLVWNGKASMTPGASAIATTTKSDKDEDDSTSSSSSSDSDSESDSDSLSDSDDTVDIEGEDPAAAKKRRKRERKRRRRERRKKKEQEALEKERVGKLVADQREARVQQTAAAAAVIGAVAVAAVAFLSGSRRQ